MMMNDDDVDENDDNNDNDNCDDHDGGDVDDNRVQAAATAMQGRANWARKQTTGN